MRLEELFEREKERERKNAVTSTGDITTHVVNSKDEQGAECSEVRHKGPGKGTTVRNIAMWERH